MTQRSFFLHSELAKRREEDFRKVGPENPQELSLHQIAKKKVYPLEEIIYLRSCDNRMMKKVVRM